jgi:hypothetical protein
MNTYQNVVITDDSTLHTYSKHVPSKQATLMTSICPWHTRYTAPNMQVSRIGIDAFRQLNDGGDLMLPSVVTANLGLKYLERKGLLTCL